MSSLAKAIFASNDTRLRRYYFATAPSALESEQLSLLDGFTSLCDIPFALNYTSLVRFVWICGDGCFLFALNTISPKQAQP